MPLHLNSFVKEDETRAVLTWILQTGINECDSFFASSDRRFLHIQRSLTDIRSRRVIGRLVFTIRCNEEQKTLEILDVDVMLDSHNPVCLRFLVLREGSSSSNEYYEVESMDGGQHLIVETVNRHTEAKDILGTERDVFVSAFPFELSIYENMDELNNQAGIDKQVQVGDSEYTITGLSESFSMPGGSFGREDSGDNHYSFMIGRVNSFRDVEIEFGKIHVPFVLAQVDTALGVMPVAMSKEVFNLEDMKEGCVIAMSAEVKADLGKPEDFRLSAQ